MIVAVMLALAATEADYWTLEFVPAPDAEVIEVGGIAFPEDDVVAVSTRRGRVWLIDGVLDDDVSDAAWTMHVDGLNEGLGLDMDGDDLLVLQRTELSRLRDEDHDRIVDEIDTITQGWGITDNYHEFAFGLPRDAQGNRWMSLNLAFVSPEWWHGQAHEPYRGWVLRVAPDGAITPWATGFRSPCGVGLDIEGRLLITDNQGDWMPSSPIYVVDRDGFHGHPAGLRWTPEWRKAGRIAHDRLPPDVERNPAAIWIPYDWSRSTGNLVPDTTGGAFGPFAGQLFVAELTNGRILRAQIEEIDGVEQGAVWKFRDRVGSAARVAFAPDDSLIVGLTNRGWGGLAPGDGVARIRWAGETPMEMHSMRLVPGGFEIDFTRPVIGDVHPDQIVAESYDYNWWWKYGSPEQRRREMPVTGTRLSGDGRTLHVDLADMRAGRVVRMRLDGITGTDGHGLLHDEVAYTINRLPGGPTIPVAKEVDPPEVDQAEFDESGWVRLMWSDPKDMWTGDWRLAKDRLDDADPSRFTQETGNNALVNDGDAGTYAFDGALPDGRYEMRVMLAERGGVHVELPGSARLVVRDLGDAGSVEVLGPDGAVLAEASRDIWRGPGQWHDLAFTIRDRRLDRVQLDDVTLIKDITLPAGTGDAWFVLGAESAGAGVADVRVQPDRHEAHATSNLLGFVHGLDGDVGGGVGPAGLWLSGGTGGVRAVNRPASFTLHLNGEFSSGTGATVQLGSGGPRIALAEGRGDAPTTGSILGADERSVRLIPDDARFDMTIDVRRDGETDQIEVHINGVPVASGRVPTAEGPIAINLDEGRLILHLAGVSLAP